MSNILSYYVMPHPPIILPEVGKGQENVISKTIMSCNKIAEEVSHLQPDTIIIVTPHGPVFKDAIAISYTQNLAGDLSSFGVKNVKLSSKINIELIDTIIEESKILDIPTIKIDSSAASTYGISNTLDHGSIVPLYFINKKYTNYNLIHITYGMLSKLNLYKFGMAIKNAVEKSPYSTIFIASGDLSHRLTEDGPYNYHPSGEVFDGKITNLLTSRDVHGIFQLDKKLINEAGECGLRSFYTMLGAMDGINVNGEFLSYEGPFGVGYGVIKFLKENGKGEKYLESLSNLPKSHKDYYISLARRSLEHFISTGRYIDMPEDLPEEMLSSKRGVFVSLHREAELRGCIGTIYPTTECVAEEIIRNAVEAGENDPRFYPVNLSEMNDLDISVDVLMPPEECSLDDLDCKKYGVIVRTQNKAGLLLPNLDGVESEGEQINIALKKAGIRKAENYSIERFEVIRHE